MLRQSLNASYRNSFACLASPSSARLPYSTTSDSELPFVKDLREKSKLPPKGPKPLPKKKTGYRNPDILSNKPITSDDFWSKLRGPRDKSNDDEQGQELRTLAGQALRPAVLSARVKLLCEAGGVKEAHLLLREAPYGVQIPVVWNTLISGVFKRERFDFAYSLYTEMKRRGVKPDLATYSTMMAGYAQIRDWSSYTKQLENCIAVHDHYLENQGNLEAKSGILRDSTSPTAKFFTILSRAGQYDRMFDVFNLLDSQGPWTPSVHVYGALVAALFFRTRTKAKDGLSVNERNASDAKLIWRQMRDAESRGFLKLDAYVVGRVMTLLSKGRPEDQQLALDIAKEYAGFTIPGEEAQPSKVSITPNLRLSVLLLLRKMRRSRLILHYTNQLMEVDSANVSVWARYVIDALHEIASTTPSDESEKTLELLKLMLFEAARRGDKTFRPTVSNYEMALMVCWRCGDWTTACEVFELMTGYLAEGFASPNRGKQSSTTSDLEKEKETPKQAPRSEGLNLFPTNFAMLNLVRTAVVSKDSAVMLQCWRMYSYFFGAEVPRPTGWDSDRFRVYHATFYSYTLARYIIDLLDGCAGLTDPSEVDMILSVRGWARKTIAFTRVDELVVPNMEKTEHDGPVETDKLKEAIDFEMQLRNYMSA